MDFRICLERCLLWYMTLFQQHSVCVHRMICAAECIPTSVGDHSTNDHTCDASRIWADLKQTRQLLRLHIPFCRSTGHAIWLSMWSLVSTGFMVMTRKCIVAAQPRTVHVKRLCAAQSCSMNADHVMYGHVSEHTRPALLRLQGIFAGETSECSRSHANWSLHTVMNSSA